MLNRALFQQLILAAQAQGVGAGGAGAATSGPEALIGPLGFLVPMALIFYLLIWRPEKKRRQSREQVLNSIKEKDKVVTIGGLYGAVVKLEKDEVVLVVDPKKDIRIRVRRSAIESIDKPAGDAKKK